MGAVAFLGSPISCGDTLAEGSGNVFVNGNPVVRQGADLTAGHCYNPVPVITGSTTVFVNNIPLTRVGDTIAVHKCGKSTHDGKVKVGSPDVFANDGSATIVNVVIEIEKYIRPGVDKLFASQVISDDPEAAPEFHAYRAQKEIEAGITPQEPIFVEEAPPTTHVPAEVPSDCSDIEAHVGKFPGSFQLSPNFTLAQLTTNTLVSNYPMKSNAGLTEKQIVCNLRNLCLNVLEPMYAMYGSNMVINSGFRYDGRSQHGKGQAADVSFKNLTTEQQWWDRANEIKQQFMYDQFIYEANRSVWYHMSYNSAGNRRKTLTKPRRTNKYYAGIQRLITQT